MIKDSCLIKAIRWNLRAETRHQSLGGLMQLWQDLSYGAGCC
jgi:hypothetical protein